MTLTLSLVDVATLSFMAGMLAGFAAFLWMLKTGLDGTAL
jgi:hypothetical protein